jgi:hypothetical protein
MGLKNFLNRKKEQANNMAGSIAGNSAMLNTLDMTIRQKISNFQKKGIPITLDRLMEGSSILIKIGMSETVIREHIIDIAREKGIELVVEQ